LQVLLIVDAYGHDERHHRRDHISAESFQCGSFSSPLRYPCPRGRLGTERKAFLLRQ